MNMKQLYRMHHGFLRRALNAGGRGYLEATHRYVGTSRDRAARIAAVKAVVATGRQPAQQFNRALFHHDSYRVDNDRKVH